MQRVVCAKPQAASSKGIASAAPIAKMFAVLKDFQREAAISTWQAENATATSPALDLQRLLLQQ
ncbi:hypothetical protein A7L55_20155 [Acinetobacter baumannii]|nr:hypothetical protein A7L55_20155 [Acinetobacter baumannii]